MIRRIVPVLALLAASASLVIGQRQSTFPHQRHANLFPLCQSCHGGIATDDAATSFPDPGLCGRCHDGVRAVEVNWSGPSRLPSNLNFSHAVHAASSSAAGDNLDCAACHSSGPQRMAVTGPDPALCGSCHAHQSTEHFARGRDCAVCHVSLVDAQALSQARVEALPAPAWHRTPDFAGSGHEPTSAEDLVSCETCHARQTCTRCHMNEPGPVMALQPDDRVAALELGHAPEYPLPPSHRVDSWNWTHAAEARAGTESCANCHEQSSCTTCHNQATVAALPSLPADDPRGVRLNADEIRVHQPGWDRGHAVEGAVSESCGSCHQTDFCEQCHTAAATPSFHGPDFVARHAPDAYAQNGDCTSCHNPEVFCRACHSSLGMGSQGRLGVAFHTANPLWLVGHGTAARQGLEACTSCHTQSSCMQCHSSLGAWRINPHGPGFDPSRMSDANPLTCLLCHRTPTGRD